MGAAAPGAAELPTRSWARVPEPECRRPVVVSPHLDDAVLSAAGFLAAHPGSVVVTVLAGQVSGPDGPLLSDWDRRCGFQPGDDPVAVRRAEDAAALALLGARPVWLSHPDSAYCPPGREPAPAMLAAALAPVLRELAPTAVAAPLGLGHPDHHRVHEAALLLRAEDPHGAAWLWYEDHPYRYIPGVLAWRLGELTRAGLVPTPAPVRRAVASPLADAARRGYRSQLEALEQDWGPALLDGAGEAWWRLLG